MNKLEKYYTVRGYRKGRVKFESIALPETKAKELRKDIVRHKGTRSGYWAKGMTFKLKKV